MRRGDRMKVGDKVQIIDMGHYGKSIDWQSLIGRQGTIKHIGTTENDKYYLISVYPSLYYFSKKELKPISTIKNFFY